MGFLVRLVVNESGWTVLLVVEGGYCNVGVEGVTRRLLGRTLCKVRSSGVGGCGWLV